MEILDVVDENLRKTGKTIIRGKEYCQKGEYLLSVDVWIFNSKGEILLSKRSAEKDHYPLMWEVTGGSVKSGEEPIDAMVREVAEEIGVKVEKEEASLVKIFKREETSKFIHIYKIVKDIAIESLEFSDGEVVDAKWVTIEEYHKMDAHGEIVPCAYFDELKIF